MTFNKSILRLGDFENTFAGFDDNSIKVFWYADGGIKGLTLSPDGETVTAGPQTTALYCDQYAFAPDCIVIYEDGLYKIQSR
ncbi:MAG: hypothetical protein LBL66_03825 [Clostridiales bacterium]|jgi:hypothetical protein|nr:hypothetical protein [Clostridiales bacterium]